MQFGNERSRAGHVGGECTAAPRVLGQDDESSLVVKNDFAQPVLPLKRDRGVYSSQKLSFI